MVINKNGQYKYSHTPMKKKNTWDFDGFLEKLGPETFQASDSIG